MQAVMANLATRPNSTPQYVQPTAASLRLRLIGQMGAWGPGALSVLPGGRKTRALLAVIAMSGPRPALRGRLAELLWSRRPEEQARASLRQEIHRLLDALGQVGVEVLQVTRDHLILRPGVAWVDVGEVMGATVKQPAALSLLDGDLLEDLDGADAAFDTWLATERERLRDHGRALAEALLGEHDDPDTTIPAAQRLLAIDRAHEGAWRALMRAHAARGERGMAIQCYDRCRAVLADQLDAAPSMETQKLLAEIRGPGGVHRPHHLSPVPRPAAFHEERAAGEDVGSGDAAAERRRQIRLGVLPFKSAGGEPGHAYLASAMADEITNALSSVRSVAVVASNALARFADENCDEDAIRQAFDLDYLLDGSIQHSRSRLRVSARLLDLGAHNQIAWARRFDCPAEDLLVSQDEIAAGIVAQIDPAILHIEGKRVALRNPATASAPELVLQAVPQMTRMEMKPFLHSGELLRRAIELEPDYAPAHAWLALWGTLLVEQGWARLLQDTIAESSRSAERAVQLDPLDPRALTIAGHVSAALQHRLHEAASLHEQALRLNQNLAMAWAFSAATHAFLGDLTEAEQRAARYEKLAGNHPFTAVFDTDIAVIHLLKRDYDAALAVGRTVTHTNPLRSAGFKPYLAALGHLGRRQEAAVALRRLLALDSQFSLQQFLEMAPFAREADRDVYVEGLRRAGVPESATSSVAVPLRA